MFSSLADRQPMIIAALIVSMIVVFYLYKENAKLKAAASVGIKPIPILKKQVKKVTITEPPISDEQVEQESEE